MPVFMSVSFKLYMYNPFPLVYVFIGHCECLLYNLPVAPQLVNK